MDSPWAVLLCKFNDDASEPFDRQFYENLFTSAGNGSNNMVDYFLDMSHGQLDCGSSTVFGWLTLPHGRQEYTDLFNRISFSVRELSIQWAQQAAMDAGVDLSRYPRTIVCWNVATDLWGGGGPYAGCDLLSMQPTVLGQEMAHGYGLMHARADGRGETDYTDPWDVMSSRLSYAADDPVYGQRSVGPGMNAWEMRYMRWIDESRVWKGSTGTITLRPLHRRDLPGYLAADLGGVLAEFRVPEHWDAGIPEATVLLHHFGIGSDDRLFHSYAMLGPHGTYEFRAGDTLGASWPSVTLHPPMVWTSQARLVSIDEVNLTATIDVTRTVAPVVVQNINDQLHLLHARRSGAAITVDGETVDIPEWDPLMPVVRQISAARLADKLADRALADKVRQSTLRSIAALATATVDGAPVTGQPAPKALGKPTPKAAK